MNLSNLLSSSDGNPATSGQPVQGKFLPPQSSVLGLNQQQYPSLPRVPGIVQQQQHLPPTLQQMTSGTSSSGMVISGVDRHRRLEGPASKKPKLYVF